MNEGTANEEGSPSSNMHPEADEFQSKKTTKQLRQSQDEASQAVKPYMKCIKGDYQNETGWDTCQKIA